MTGTKDVSCTADKSCSEATGVQQRLMKALRFAVEAGECTPAFASAVGHLLEEGDAFAQDEAVRVAHLVHRVMRAEANIDGADLSQTMRAPDIQVGREGIERFELPKTSLARSNSFEILYMIAGQRQFLISLHCHFKSSRPPSRCPSATKVFRAPISAATFPDVSCRQQAASSRLIYKLSSKT